MWSIYLLVNDISEENYIGITSNLERRIKEHNSATNENHFTNRKIGKWVLVYSENFLSREDAVKRERRLKAHGRAKQELYKRALHSYSKAKSGAGKE